MAWIASLFTNREDVIEPEWINRQRIFSESLQLLSSLPGSVVGQHRGYGVDIRQSTIPNSGFGVFAEKDFSKGQVVTLYPGTFYPPLPNWLVALPDGNAAVDLRPQNTDFCNVYKINCLIGGALEAKEMISSNIALAHLVNHPPKGTLPNVISYEFHWNDFFRDVPTENLPKIKEITHSLSEIRPGTPWFIDPNTQQIEYMTEDCAPIVGMVFIANRDIRKGEEFFFNYKFQKGKDLPEWYHPVE
jgi:hypothetical protein